MDPPLKAPPDVVATDTCVVVERLLVAAVTELAGPVERAPVDPPEWAPRRKDPDIGPTLH